MLLGIGANEEMLMLSLESRDEGTEGLSILDDDKRNRRDDNDTEHAHRRMNLPACKTFYRFLTYHDEPLTCYLPNPYTHIT